MATGTVSGAAGGAAGVLPVEDVPAFPGRVRPWARACRWGTRLKVFRMTAAQAPGIGETEERTSRVS